MASYDEWKERGMDEGLDSPFVCDACRKGLHRFCGELDDGPCECDECGAIEEDDE